MSRDRMMLMALVGLALGVAWRVGAEESRAGADAPAGGAAAKDAGSAPAPADRPAKATEEDIARAVKIDDKPKFLTDTIEMFKAKKYRNAGVNLTKLINSSRPDELDALSAQAEKEFQKTLAELAAEAHIEMARENAKDGAIKLMFVTAYEQEALAKKLEAAYTEALGQTIALPEPAKETAGEKPEKSGDHEGADGPKRPPGGPVGRAKRQLPGGPGPGPGGEPAPGSPGAPPSAESPQVLSRSLTINEFKAEPKKFDGIGVGPEQMAAFAKHIAYAVSLIDARMQYDPKYRLGKDRDAKQVKQEKETIAKERKALLDLQATVRTVANLTEPKREQRKFMMEQAEKAKKAQEERKNQQKNKAPKSSGKPATGGHGGSGRQG